MELTKLVLLPGFATNEGMLSNYIDLLRNYFDVELVQLPGFDKNVKPLSKINLDNYIQYFNQKITSKMNIPYIIGGISFGYSILNELVLNHDCKGVFAILPYLGSDSLRMDKTELFKLSIGTKVLSNNFLANKFWKSNYFRKRLLNTLTPSQLKIREAHFDPKTYFMLGHDLINLKNVKPRSDIKTCLIYSLKDEMLSPSYVLDQFTKNIQNLLVIESNISHYPKNLTKENLEKEINPQIMGKIASFFTE